MSGGRADRFAVVSRRAVYFGGLVLGALAVLAFLTERTALGIVLVVIVFLAVLARGMMTLARGRRALAARQRAEVPTVTGYGLDSPAPVATVVAALVGMNADGLPYRIDAKPGPGGVRVEVRWKQEELRWQSLFVNGSRAYAWRMEVDLDPTRGAYKFIEHSGSATVRSGAGPGGAAVYGAWTWRRGKTGGKRQAMFVEGADGKVQVVDSGGPRTSWEGVASITPSDAKAPVFTVLRGHGWRPRVDWFGARLFEK
ncbi:hypothetical protein [Glycomyces sp. NRRL B-16210]|uniref:hypothetical protein n=1 Tax=Glycomyces sp. NRRL B-16210 TaxID=1463821 RepID=UPI0004BFAD7B|nr:hypothetical protein [Glycomyces sp. NRRL B-16210]